MKETMIGITIGIAGLLIAICIIVFCEVTTASVECNIFNRKFGTDFTTHEYFWGRYSINKLYAERIPERPKPYQVELNVK